MSTESASEKPSSAELEWIDFTEYVSKLPKQEGLKEKLVRKTKENPFVPIGVLATTCALGYGLWCMKSGNSNRSQAMMRTRIGAQGFTIAAIILGMLYGASSKAAP